MYIYGYVPHSYVHSYIPLYFAKVALGTNRVGAGCKGESDPFPRECLEGDSVERFFQCIT